MELDEALAALRRVLVERENVGRPGTAAAAVEAARTVLACGVDTPLLWELGVLPEWDVTEADRLLAGLEQEFWPALRLPTTVEARRRMLARYCLQDLLDDRIDPMAAAVRLGFELRPADDPGSPLRPFSEWLHRAKEQQEHCGGPTEELLAELYGLAARVLAGPLV